MAARIYRDRDADLEFLRGKVCAVLGYGAQGRAQALNLRESGLDVLVALPAKSKTRLLAQRDGLKVVETTTAARRGDVIFLALPDTEMPAIYRRQIAPYLAAGKTLVFAHGFAIHYRTIVPPKDIDVIMVAPNGVGPIVRREFAEGRGVPGMIAVHQNPSRHARQTALAWAKAIGCTRAGVLLTTFQDETETDLFAEQAVLCGGVNALVCAGFETLVAAGYAPEAAYFSCLHELKYLVDLMHEGGIAGMRACMSPTATWGDLTVGPQIIDRAVQKKMAAALKKIQSGQFAREWIRETQSGQKRYRQLLAEANRHPIEKVGARLRGG
ncbi:MAG: ketol-acid reductoisomerase [Verrucomicrobiota bacterium]|nr:ketol-acid reductoisomerase [Verrucomicrobiota bacterium]